jgi:hypothetical protein
MSLDIIFLKNQFLGERIVKNVFLKKLLSKELNNIQDVIGIL